MRNELVQQRDRFFAVAQALCCLARLQQTPISRGLAQLFHDVLGTAARVCGGEHKRTGRAVLAAVQVEKLYHVEMPILRSAVYRSVERARVGDRWPPLDCAVAKEELHDLKVAIPTLDP